LKAVIQNYATGELSVKETPPPQLRAGHVLVRTVRSAISAGTEKTKVDTGRKSLLGKAKARPDLVKKVIEKAKREGLWKTWQTVSDRLNTPIPLGYSCAGEVLEVCGDVNGLRPGDRVACGGGTANHAEVVCVPKNLAVPVPETVSYEQAAFATIGAIAMQGCRQADCRMGERVAVIGLGLIGLLTTQMLRASGCRVFGIDIAAHRLDMARTLGCDEVAHANDETLMEAILLFTEGYGVDATLITAGTSSNQPVEQAAGITRERGKVVVVGLTKMDIPREPFYMKELDLRLSRSYGPGRYDRNYEDHGNDYPFGYVRFTEQRNMACFLELVARQAVRTAPIVTHRFKIEDAGQAYDLIHGETSEPYLGVTLEYPETSAPPAPRVDLSGQPAGEGQKTIGVIGVGNYATTHLLPWVKQHPSLSFGLACTASGMTARHVGERFNFEGATADVDELISESDAVIVATRHNDHAGYVIKALGASKPVFVEKPLGITGEQIDAVVAAAEKSDGGTLAVGFNRRFAPATRSAVAHFGQHAGPKSILIRVNAGPIPSDSWIQDPKVGGGRLIGEGCHFVDLAVALSGSLITRVDAAAIPVGGQSAALWDNFSICLGMADGSIANILYTSTGASGLGKEYIEVHGGGRTAIIDDFHTAELISGSRREKKKSSGVDKGQKNQIKAWADALAEGSSTIPFDEIINVHRACFAAIQSMTDGQSVRL